MGLDMYLRANQYISRNDWSRNENGELQDQINPLFNEIVERLEMKDVIDNTGFAGISIDFPMGYWRKANQIHAWFVNNVQDGEDNCGSYYVSRNHLEELKEICEQVLADNSLAMELLPPSAGFFFGATDVDEYYYGDLQETIDIVDRCLKTNFDSFEYQSSW